MIDSSLSRCSSFDRLIPSFFLLSFFLFSLSSQIPFQNDFLPLSLFFVHLRRKKEKERKERKKERRKLAKKSGSKLSARESEKKKKDE